jgi:hypothetical protein
MKDHVSGVIRGGGTSVRIVNRKLTGVPWATIALCYLQVEPVYARDHRTPRGYRARWWSRRTTTLMYSSVVCSTAQRARELAMMFAARNRWLVDTTEASS